MKRVVALVGAVVVLAGAYFLLVRSAPEHAQGKPEAGTSPTPRRVVALGRLAPRNDVINVGAPPGDRLAELRVSEGQHVAAGQILAALDSYAERVADRRRIAAQLAEADARLAAETAYATAQADEARARLRQLETSSGLQVQSQEARVQQLEAERENASRELERVTRLRGRELVAQQDLDRQTLAARRADLELRAARVELERLRQAHLLDVQVARAQLATALAGLRRAEQATDIGSLRESQRLAEARVERALVRAPVSGSILKILQRPGKETGSGPILQMGDVAQMYAIAEVYETDVPRVRPGQKATVTSSALGERLHGTVEVVGQAIARNQVVDVDPSAAVDRRIAEVKIRLEDSRRAATLVNLQVNVEIDASRP